MLVIISSLAGCCSVEDINNVVENAIIPCPDNSWWELRITVILYSLQVSNKCPIVVRMGYWRPSYYHACVRCLIFPWMTRINFQILLPGLYFFFASIAVLHANHRWIKNNVLRMALYQLSSYIYSII